MNKFNEQNACFREEEEDQSNNFKCYTCKKSYSNIQDLSKHLISIQHEERINYNIGLIELNNQLLKLIKKDEHEKRMNCLNQELLEINKRTDKLREERKERVRIEKERINAFLSLFCLKIV
jgi:hypothetical protein